MQPANPCTHCKGAHKGSRCPELADPLKEGFYTGGGAHRDHGGDDDEHCKKLDLVSLLPGLPQDSNKKQDDRLFNLL